MPNSFEKLFSQKNNILSIYFTAGYPELNDTIKILDTLQSAGADMVEIGIPYSDPLADGPTIQNSGMKALDNGMTIKKLFDQLLQYKESKKSNENVFPLVLMGYLNPVLQFGVAHFCRKANECGVSGIIIPDLPIDIYEKDFKPLFEKYNLQFIFLITPQTSEERIRKIDSLSHAFIYVVSSSSITGFSLNVEERQEYFKRIKNMGLRNKLLIGFGISTKETFLNACKFADGAIIGSAYIKSLENSEDVESSTREFINGILEPLI